MGLRCGLNPVVEDGVIRFGWAYQYEHEQGIEPLGATRWTEIGGGRALVAHPMWNGDDARLERVWQMERTQVDGGSRVWVLWDSEGFVAVFLDPTLAAAVKAGPLSLSYGYRSGNNNRSGEGVLCFGAGAVGE